MKRFFPFLPSLFPLLLVVLGFIAFVVLATANGAGYRYGVSDEAAYVPAVMLAEQPAAFPRDAPLIRTQGHFFVVDEILAVIGLATGASIETRFFAAYLLAMATVWAAVLLNASSLYRTNREAPPGSVAGWWLTIALGAAITLRHHIPRTSANSLEPYFHPRLLAFGIGAIAIAAFLRRRDTTAILLVVLAGICHVTTGMWFAIVIGVALMVVDTRWRLPGLVTVVLTALVLAWATGAGPLRAAATTMDPLWIEALNGRDFIFANQWPLWTWMANLGLLAALWMVHALRVRRGRAKTRDAGLAWGATALVGVFLATLPLVAAHVALAVQIQFSRVFWIVDFLLVLYAIAAVGESPQRTRAITLALLLLAASTGRASYIMWSEHAERRLFQATLPASAWTDAMQWIARQPLHVHVLAAPDHAFRYGASVRVAAERDVLLEDDKDSAVAMYSREIAQRVVERRRVLAGFSSLTAPAAQALAERYDLHYLVTEAALPLPEVYRNSQFRIYVLKPTGPSS